MKSACALGLAGVLAVALAPAVSASSALDGYREFVRSPEATVLLADARGAMLEYFDGVVPTAASSDTVETAAPPPLPKSAGTRVLSLDDAPIESAETGWPAAPCGLYVSLLNGKATRACVGSATPPRGTLKDAVRAIAVQALAADRRRSPVRRDELDGLRIVISFAASPIPIADPMTIAPARDGLLVTGDQGSVAFLPGEARTVSWALREARRSGVLGDSRAATYARFEVVTLSETAPPRSKPGSKDDESP
jgi:hypothetical protein